MHILIAAIGKLKSGPEQALYNHYIRRLPWKITVKEHDIKKILSSPERKQQEAELLLATAKDADHIIALDEQGKDLTSNALATHMQQRSDEGARTIAFLIGGADGLHDNIRRRAHLTLSLGRMTWPHLLVRGLLAEQLYRVYTILHHHPYHRE